jgi:hypothetical protein
VTHPPAWFSALFVLVAAAGCSFYSFKAFEIFGVSTTGKPRSWLIHQRWLNFAGAAAGWASLWFVARAFWIGETPSAGTPLLAVVAFAGVTGHVPQALHAVLGGFSELSKRFTDFLFRGDGK